MKLPNPVCLEDSWLGVAGGMCRDGNASASANNNNNNNSTNSTSTIPDQRDASGNDSTSTNNNNSTIPDQRERDASGNDSDSKSTANSTANSTAVTSSSSTTQSSQSNSVDSTISAILETIGNETPPPANACVFDFPSGFIHLVTKGTSESGASLLKREVTTIAEKKYLRLIVQDEVTNLPYCVFGIQCHDAARSKEGDRHLYVAHNLKNVRTACVDVRLLSLSACLT